MKKTVSVLIIMALCFCMVSLVSCAEKEPHTVTVCFVTVDKQERKSVSSDTTEIQVEHGSPVGDISSMCPSGTFVGLYTDKVCMSEWNMHKDKVKSDMTLYLYYK